MMTTETTATFKRLFKLLREEHEKMTGNRSANKALSAFDATVEKLGAVLRV